MNQDLLNDIEQLGTALLSLARGQSKLFMLEAELAKKSIIPFIVTMALCLLAGLALWLCLELSLGYGLYILSASVITSLAMMALINISFLLIMVYFLMAYKRNMGFTETRHNLKSMMSDAP